MKYRFKTTGIYSGADTIQVSIEYKKGEGYVAIAEAIEVNEELGLYGKIFAPEYYKFYNDLVMNIVTCGRKSDKRLKEAEEWLANDPNALSLAMQWIDYAVARGGRKDIRITEYSKCE